MVVSGSGKSENTSTLISNITDIDPNTKLKSENYHNGVYEIVLIQRVMLYPRLEKL